MEQFIQYLDTSLPDRDGGEILYKFKKKTLDEMNDRYLEVSQRGISNQKVISDLVISEHPNLENEYKAFYNSATAAAKTKRKILLNVIGSAVYILGIVIVFLAVSFVTQHWGQTWLIVVDGILLWVAYLLSLGVKKITSMRRIFHIFARILLALDVMVLTVAVFLFTLVMIGFAKSWLIVIAGIALMFAADAVYITVTKQKLAIIYYLIYIPAAAAMLYIIFSAIGITAWSSGWLLIIFSLFIDMLIIYISIARNKREKREVIDAWKEN